MGLFLVSLLVVVGLSACFNPFNPKVSGTGVTEPAPIPNSPTNLLRLLEWCYMNRAIFEYRELFDNDYRFVFGTLDPDGNAYRANPWTREDEVESTTHLFQGGGANQPAANSIVILLDRNFRVGDDPNHPGRGHKLIRTSVTIRIVADETQREVQGYANFFLVRGDSAVIPAELLERGFEPDSNRWYILRHEDDTLPPDQAIASAPMSHAAAVPATPAAATVREYLVGSWGSVKYAYR
jgi:hypothetical protein